MSNTKYYCKVCDCDMDSKSRFKHLKSKKHLDNLNGKESEDDSDKRKCGTCQVSRGLDQFRGENITCNKCLDKWKRYKQNNPDKVAEWRQTYNMKHFQNIKDEVYTCPICDYEIKKYKKAQHEKGIGHRYLLELKERGEEMEKPDRIIIDEDGKEWHECLTCKTNMPKHNWAAHLIGSYHIKCKNERET